MKMHMMQSSVLAAALAAVTAPNVQADQTVSAPVPEPDRTYTGQITSVDPSENTVAVKSSFFSSRHFNLSGNCQYLMVGKGVGTMADLRPGEKVMVRYQVAKGVPIADVVQQEPMRFEGMVVAIDANNRTLTVRNRGLDKPMQIGDTCDVQLRGAKTGGLADIRPGDHVLVTYELPQGTPTARNIEQTAIEFTGRLTFIDLDQRILKARGVTDTVRFNVANNCAIVVNGRTDAKISDLRPNDRFVFDYDNINGVNVVSRIAPAPPETRQPTYTSTPVYPAYPTGF